MVEMWVPIEKDKQILLKYSSWSGKVHAYLDGKEVAKLGMMGGIATFNVEEHLVEIESRLTAWLTNRTTIRVDGRIVYQGNWL